MRPIDQAVEKAGGVSALAEALGVVQTAVSNWRSRNKVPAERCIAIEQATGVSRYELRPDVFGPAPKSKPAKVA